MIINIETDCIHHYEGHVGYGGYNSQGIRMFYVIHQKDGKDHKEMFPIEKINRVVIVREGNDEALSM